MNKLVCGQAEKKKMVTPTPTGETCIHCGGQMMQSDMRDPDEEPWCESGCKSIVVPFPFNRAGRLNDADEEFQEENSPRFRCFNVGCGYTSDTDSSFCQVCEEYSMSPND
jgi:hypothetical protein